MEYKDELYILLDVFIATVLTAFVGLERESLHKPAGMRTNMIVGGAACLIVALTVPLLDFINSYNPSEIINTDPIRVLQAIVIGISFLGAGTIIKGSGQENVIGLTTAATLLYCCAIGICIALKQYVLGVGVTIMVILINYGLRILLRKISKDSED